MTERIQQELAMLRAWWSGLDFVEAGLWVRLAGYRVPSGAWRPEAVEVAFQIPVQLPGQAPYGFYKRPGLTAADGAPVSNYTYPTQEPPFGGAVWGKFSWAPSAWTPAAEPALGSNMVEFARSIADRLREGA